MRWIGGCRRRWRSCRCGARGRRRGARPARQLPLRGRHAPDRGVAPALRRSGGRAGGARAGVATRDQAPFGAGLRGQAFFDRRFRPWSSSTSATPIPRCWSSRTRRSRRRASCRSTPLRRPRCRRPHREPHDRVRRPHGAPPRNHRRAHRRLNGAPLGCPCVDAYLSGGRRGTGSSGDEASEVADGGSI